MNAHADMFIVAEHNELNTPRGIYRSLVSGERNFAGFLLTKTSANKRLLIMSANRLLGLHRKGTTKFASVQIFKVKSEKCRV